MPGGTTNACPNRSTARPWRWKVETDVENDVENELDIVFTSIDMLIEEVWHGVARVLFLVSLHSGDSDVLRFRLRRHRSERTWNPFRSLRETLLCPA